MRVQSAEVSALLTLDASGFNSGINTAKTNVEKLSNLMNNLNFSKATANARNLESTIQALNTTFNKFNVEMSKAEAFNKIALAMERLSNTARTLAESNSSLSGTYQHLENLVGLFANALSKTEVTLKGNLQVTRQVAESNNQVANSVRVLGNGYNTFLSKISEVNSQMERMKYPVNTTTNAVSQLETRAGRFISTMTTGLPQIVSGLRNMTSDFQRINTSINVFDRVKEKLYQMQLTATQTARAMQYLNSTMGSIGSQVQTSLSPLSGTFSNVTSGVENLNTSLRATQTATNLTSTGISNVTNSAGNLNYTMDGVSNTTNKTSKELKSASDSSKSLSQGLTTASSNASTANQRFNGLHKTLSSLRMMLSMVGSMFLFNFAHNMMISVSNTVKAKSEMLSYLHTMGLTEGQINSFNSALDKTTDRFQRINKYNIGETVANIGLEFDLSAKEMEKAMSVTSMITSEYLRAGRSADEASLAVKDILQGQFQRLSRETGVKGEQLKEAGWSGDENDVLGLMEALEKVAKARHWDTFAEKASSLNDIILITQNRLSEWATDMSEGVVPMVTDSFNFLVATVDGVTKIFGTIGSALNLPDWTGTALLITGVGLALTGLLTATITARTGLGLLDIKHQGLTQSIIATIFNIKAEELEYQKASSIALGRVLGLNSEVVARNGVKAAIKAQVGLEQAENLIKKEGMGVTQKDIAVQQLENLCKERKISTSEKAILMERLEASQSLSTYQAIMTKVLGLNAEIVSEQGLLVALGASRSARIADAIATEGEAVAEETLNKARLIGIATMSVYLAALVAIAAVAAVFLLPAIQQVQSMNEHMKTFHTLIDDGDNMIKDARNTMNSYDEKVQQLKADLESGTLTAEEYRRKQLELKEANDLLKSSTQELADVTEAVQLARSGKAKSEESRTKSATKAHQDLQDALGHTLKDTKKAEEQASKYYYTLGDGLGVMRELANHEEWNRGRFNDKYWDISKRFEGKEKPEETAKRITDYADIQQNQNKQYQKMLESESLGEYLEGFLGFHWYQGMENLADMGNEWDEKVAPAFQNMGESLSDVGQGFIELVSGFDLVGSISDLFSPLTSWLDSFTVNDVLGGLDKWITDGLNWFNNIDIGKMISDWWNQSDWSDIMDIGQVLNDNITQPVMNWWNETTSWLDSFTVGGLFNKLLGLDENTDIGALIGEKLASAQEYIMGFVNYIGLSISNLPSTIQGILSQAVGHFVSFASNLLSQGITAGSNFVNGASQFFSQLPTKIRNYLVTALSHIISVGSQWVTTARNKAVETVAGVITQVSQLPQKVYNEFMKIPQRIKDSINEAVKRATEFGDSIKNAVLGALKIFSPGIVQQKIAQEFADIPSRISEQNANAQTQASSFGQSIVDGMDSQMSNVTASATALTDAMNQTQPDVVLDGSFVGDYQTDANTIGNINQNISTNTATTFGLLGDTVNNTISGMSTNLQTSYTNMNTTQTTALTNMQTNNTNAYNKLQTTTTTSLNNMRNTTQNVTLQMVNAWDHMKDNIISSANQLKTQSTAHFNTLSSHIGTFYRKLQNPSMWGAGDKVPTRYYNSARGHRGINAVKRTFGVTPPRKGYAGGYTLDNLPQTTTIRKLKQMVGNSPIFNGMDLDQEVNTAQFLSLFGSFGWNDWHPTHFNKVKTTSGDWKMRGPQIMHRIDTGESFQVKEFYNSQPNISFGSFQHMAEALFSAIPYEFYYNSDAHGSWQNALQAGSCNCYDGANALVALAHTCGFDGHIEHGTWNGVAHVYAVINGKKMDTTGWQQRRDWNGVSAGSPPNMPNGNKTVNINIDMSNSTFNGEDDFRDRMKSIAQEVMREEVNTSITVGI